MKDNNLAYDILKEIFNIGVGKAADMLSQMVNKKILLNVPSIKVIGVNNDDISLDKYFNKGIKGTLMVSFISFQEEINGEANLIFPADKMRNIINFCIEEEESSANEDLDFTDIDFDIIREIGNIILNSRIGEIGNFLDVNLEYTLPSVKIFKVIDFEEGIKNREDMHSLLLSISFIIDDTEIEGAVIINFTINSLKDVMEIVKKMEEGLYG